MKRDSSAPKISDSSNYIRIGVIGENFPDNSKSIVISNSTPCNLFWLKALLGHCLVNCFAPTMNQNGEHASRFH
jgi:hypothetical protein